MKPQSKPISSTAKKAIPIFESKTASKLNATNQMKSPPSTLKKANGLPMNNYGGVVCGTSTKKIKIDLISRTSPVASRLRESHSLASVRSYGSGNGDVKKNIVNTG